MTYLAYKLIHLVGVVLLFTALGALVVRQVGGHSSPRDRGGRLAGMTHGLALILIVVSGFGALAKLGLGLPVWAWAKLGIWLLLGASLLAIRRMPSAAPWLWWLLPILGGVAAWLALYKPGG